MSSEILVSGFTFIKNGLSLGYPFVESVESIEPLCDEIIINVGFDDPNLSQDDGTYNHLIKRFNHPKFKFLKSYWDPSLKKGGAILAQQTNIALDACQGEFCLYIQGDEAIHQNDYPVIQDSILAMKKNPTIQGLIFNYIHFYGNVDIYKYTRNIYRREVRLIRNRIGLISWQDAQGFRFKDGSKMLAAPINAYVYHYGWARQEQVMQKKITSFDKLYHGDEFEQKEKFEYQKIYGLKKFTKTHPNVMNTWIEANRNKVDILNLKPKHSLDNISLMLSDIVEKITGYRFGEFKNYRLKNIKLTGDR